MLDAIHHPWYGKKVAFLGDSITDSGHVGTTKNYWQFLAEDLAVMPYVYGVNGQNWGHLPSQIAQLQTEHAGDVDGILIFMGTNDFNASVPLGEWFTAALRQVNADGRMVTRMERTLCMTPDTFRGRINIAMNILKRDFVRQQIILLTPLHRAFARFSADNVQPPESFANALGNFIGDYVSAIVEAGSRWSVPVIDLYSIAGLYPMEEAHGEYFHDPQSDRLHPNAAGHRRIAKVLEYQLAAFPADFKD